MRILWRLVLKETSYAVVQDIISKQSTTHVWHIKPGGNHA